VDPTAGGWTAIEAALEHAAWFGHPADGIAVLPALDPTTPTTDTAERGGRPAGVDLDGAVPERVRWPAGVDPHDPAAAVPERVRWPAGVDPHDPAAAMPERVRWLAGVCLGAVGRYRTAAGWLAPGGEPAGSLAASCLASHLRQVGRHAEAEPADRLALATAATVEARADALIGLVADAVGRHELALARDRLELATEQIVAVTSDHTEWRARVRLEWVGAETALLAGDAARAVEIGRTAQRISRKAILYRHTVKSTLVLGVALDAAGRTRAAARVLRTASRGATQLGLTPLLSPIHSVLAGTLRDRAPRVAARERRRADAAQSIREDPAESQSFS
jgi:hypothetical protein